MSYATIYLETDDGSELEIEIEFTYSYQPAYISGPPEDCYPEESDFEWNISEDHRLYNALEWWAIQSIDDDSAYRVCVENNEGLDMEDGYYE